MQDVFREVLYRLRPRPGHPPAQLPFVLSRGLPTIVVETRATHLDSRGRVWRILVAQGAQNELETVRQRFDTFAPPHLIEKNLLGRTDHGLFLWYKYRVGPARGPFSHTALAFRLLGRDTHLTDRTQGDEMTIRLLSRPGPALQRFLNIVRKRTRKDFDVDLLYAGPPQPAPASALTPQEDALLRVAAGAGYFDVPRRISLAALARRVSISTSGVGYRLRRAQAKLATAYLARPT